MAEAPENQLSQASKPPPTTSGRGEAGVVYVQRPVKQVVTAEENPGSRLLASIGGCILLGLLLTLCFGLVGQRLGFEAALGLVPTELSALDAMVLGLSMMQQAPRTILLSGSAYILLPVLGLLMLAFPLAFAALARPRSPGGPLPRSGVRFLSMAAGTLGGLIGFLGFIWLLLPARTTILDRLPLDPAAFADSWQLRLVVVASIDVFAFLITLLWVILLFRLPLRGLGWTWLRVVTVFFTICLFIGCARSIGLHQGLVAQRPLLDNEPDTTAVLMLGELEGDPIVYVLDAGRPPRCAVRDVVPGSPVTCSSTESIESALLRMTP